MSRKGFHHPDTSWRLFRRQVGNELLHLVAGYIVVAATRGRSLIWNESLPGASRLRAAVYRLRKQGLITEHRGPYRAPRLVLTPKGEERIRTEMNPERFWNKKWGGTWYLLMYDVPEKARPYRNALRGFLARMRMGCLQKSVWISHQDIRPEFADLREAAAIDDYAFLFEAQSVLGMEPWRIACAAWHLDELEQRQRRYCDYAREEIGRLQSGDMEERRLETLAREEMEAYLAAMEKDPLLPASLCPGGYLGRMAWNLHLELIGELGRRLQHGAFCLAKLFQR